jgi:1-acyl-sn-glycerol-3-phosphate acyltransferase
MVYRVVKELLAFLFRAIYRPRVIGLEHVPPKGPLILASNHVSFIDSMVIPMLVPRRVHFLAKDDYFTGTGIKGTLSRWWFNGFGMIPVDRDDTRAAIASLDIALDVLGKGEAFGIYPEGTRSRDGRIYRGRTGVGHLALTSGASVVPVALTGTERLLPRGARIPRRVPVTVEFGPALTFTGRYDGVPTGRARREITDEIMTTSQAMSGQEPAGKYNDRPPET